MSRNARGALVFKAVVNAVLPVVVLGVVAAVADSSGDSYALYMFAWIFSFPIAVIYFFVSLVKNTRAQRKDPDLYAKEPLSDRVSREVLSWVWAGLPLGAVALLFLAGASASTGVGGGGALAIVPVGLVLVTGAAVAVAIEASSTLGGGAGGRAKRPKGLWKFLTDPRPVRK